MNNPALMELADRLVVESDYQNELIPNAVHETRRESLGKLRDLLREAAAALRTAAAEGGQHGHAAACDELSTREVMVPCDCGCGRQCCAACGCELGFIQEKPTDSGAGRDGDGPGLNPAPPTIKSTPYDHSQDEQGPCLWPNCACDQPSKGCGK